MVNKVILIGNVGVDPEVRTLESGAKVARVRLATTERLFDRQATRQNEKMLCWGHRNGKRWVCVNTSSLPITPTCTGKRILAFTMLVWIPDKVAEKR